MVDRLPIDEALPGLVEALRGAGRAVLEAPPGAGKTTRVPLALLEAGLVHGRIVMLAPRRLAAIAAGSLALAVCTQSGIIALVLAETASHGPIERIAGVGYLGGLGETVAARLADLRALGAETVLAITARRAETLKARPYDGDLARIRLPADADLGWILAVADPADDLARPMKGPLQSARDGDAALHRVALRLVKTAHLLPAALVTALRTVRALPRCTG